VNGYLRVINAVLKFFPTVLHPYYKLQYIKLAWGGEKEQAEECAAGNQNAKNWQDEAQKILETTVCVTLDLLLIH
jgi:hypothetical protein